MTAILKPAPNKNMVLAKAVLNIAEQLHLTQSELGAIIGMHRTAISKLNAHPNIDPHSKSGELALLLIRFYRALYALTGGDQVWMRHFINTQNKITGGIPKNQMKTITGLVTVLQTVDALRGKI